MGVDFIDNLPVSSFGRFNAIVVFVCHLRKMVRLVPTRLVPGHRPGSKQRPADRSEFDSPSHIYRTTYHLSAYYGLDVPAI